jgi:hypothetical protein
VVYRSLLSHRSGVPGFNRCVLWKPWSEHQQHQPSAWPSEDSGRVTDEFWWLMVLGSTKASNRVLGAPYGLLSPLLR